jgi:hypothetical protein
MNVISMAALLIGSSDLACLLNAHTPPIFGIVHAHRYRIGIPMLDELTNLPTDTLLDIVFFILAGRTAVNFV